MANLGDIRISTDYQVLKQGPMDARLKKQTKSDLIDPESWASSGSDVYVYPTMLVGIEDSGEIYKLLSIENIFAEDYSGWELLGSNASAAPEIYIGSEEPTDENVVVWYDPNDNIEDPWTVDSELNESSSNPIANAAVAVKINELQNTQSEIETSLSEKLSETTADSKYQPKGDYLTAEDLPEMPELAIVATTGNYEDLSNKPTFKTINNQEITGEGNLVIEEKKYNIHLATSGELSDEQKAENKIIFDLAASGNQVPTCYLNGTLVFYSGSTSYDGKLAIISYAGNAYLGAINSDTVMQEVLVLVDIDSEGNTSPKAYVHKHYLDNVAAIDSKQDTLVSGNNIKTINGETILGEGNIDTNQKYTIYFTTEEGTTLTDEQKASNKVIYDLAVEGKAPLWCYSMNNELPLQFYGMQTESDITYAAYVYDQIVSKTDEKSENIYLLVGIKEDGDIYTNGTFGYNILHEDAVLNAINGGSTSELQELKTGNTDEDKANNVAVVQSFLAGKAIPFIQEDGRIIILSSGVVEEDIVIFNASLDIVNSLQDFGPIAYITQLSIIISDDGTLTINQVPEVHPQNAQMLTLSTTPNLNEVNRAIQTMVSSVAQNASSIVVWGGNKPCVENELGDNGEWIFGWFEDGILHRFIMDLNTGESRRVDVPNSYPLTSLGNVATISLSPGVFYEFTGEQLQIELTPPVVTNWVNEYVMKIVCTGTPNITLPSGLIWANDIAPVFTAGKTYVISIIDNLAVFAEFTTAS